MQQRRALLAHRFPLHSYWTYCVPADNDRRSGDKTRRVPSTYTASAAFYHRVLLAHRRQTPSDIAGVAAAISSGRADRRRSALYGRIGRARHCRHRSRRGRWHGDYWIYRRSCNATSVLQAARTGQRGAAWCTLRRLVLRQKGCPGFEHKSDRHHRNDVWNWNARAGVGVCAPEVFWCRREPVHTASLGVRTSRPRDRHGRGKY
mmetsp:Transcript_21364/g.50192  ORF Transcript_21364/g.50192 Transcript_21364/m.50192 type:complete len:204 (+) Transcript_21364:1767-2378(+)